jgi:AraC family transcriptional regulator of arabinose operon
MEIVKIGSNGTHDQNFKISRPKGYPYYLFLLVKTPALFVIDDEEIKVESGSFIIYDINYPHYYCAYNSIYINDWIHFRLENGTDYFESLNIPLNTVVKIWDDTFVCDMIKLMANEYYSINTNKEKTMNLLLPPMFVKLSEVISTRNSRKHTNAHYSELVSLRKEIYSNPQVQWRVDMLANKINMCNTYLQKIYRETFGISCVADVIACKINYAKDILSKSNMLITDVATECGYNNEVHFMRQFKKSVGVTPSEYRKNGFTNS